MNEDVKILIDGTFMNWSGHDPDLADKSAAQFIDDYGINEKTTFEECKKKLLEFRNRMDAIRSMMVYGSILIFLWMN